jgi:hypothetical protein
MGDINETETYETVVAERDALTRVVEIQREALELVANIQHGLNGRNAGRNTFRAIAKKALAEAAKILGDGE